MFILLLSGIDKCQQFYIFCLTRLQRAKTPMILDNPELTREVEKEMETILSYLLCASHAPFIYIVLLSTLYG